MMNQKEKLLLHQLHQQQGKFVSSGSLAQALSCSDRTVRNYMKSLIEYFDCSGGAKIVAKQGFGYSLQVGNQEEYFRFLASNHINFDLERLGQSERLNYLINKLLFEQDSLLFEELMDQLFVSRSTLSADFRKVRELLEPYHLSVTSRANKGVSIEGREQDKRHFIMDYFFSGQFLKHLHHYVDHDLLQLPISFEELTLIVLEECRSHGVGLPDFAMQNLVIHIALAFRRIRDGFEITPLDLKRQSYDEELGIARGILERVSHISHQEFPETEIDYIALHLLGKGRRTERIESQVSGKNLRQDVMVALSYLEEVSTYPFGSDQSLIDGLVSHLSILVERLESSVRLTNPLLDDIKKDYPDSFELTKIFISRLESLVAYELQDDELAYISLHLLASMERYREQFKKKVLVICATGYGSARMLKNRIQNELGNYVEVVNLIGYYDISDEVLCGVDCIISAIDLSNLVFNIPVFQVSIFLKDEEVRKIKEALGQLATSPTLAKADKAKTDLKTAFDYYFSEETFFLASQTDKSDVIEALVERICLNQPVSNKEKLLCLISQREKMSTVIFDQDIAVPHPLKTLDQRGQIGLALIPDGLYWDEAFPRIRLVFLVCPSSLDSAGLPDLVQVLVDLTENPKTKEKLIACPDFEAFRTVFLEFAHGTRKEVN